MFILSIDDQNQLITQYQKDLGLLILDYNKCDMSKKGVNIIRNKAELLYLEVIQNSGYRKELFAEENLNYLLDLASEIRKFIKNYLNETSFTGCGEDENKKVAA